MVWIVALIVIGSTIWVVVDSKKNQIPTYGEAYTLNTGALTWFIGCVLLWICAFPLYLYRRQKFLNQRRPKPAPIVAPVPAVSNLPASLEQELRTLAKLKADGIISEDEFQQKKCQLLGLAQSSGTTQKASPAVFTVQDAERDIMRYTEQRELESPLTKKFEDEGFANVELAYHIGKDGWDFNASRGTNQDCQTSEQVKAIVARLAGEVNHEIANGLIVALVLGDQIAARFRLQPRPQPV